MFIGSCECAFCLLRWYKRGGGGEVVGKWAGLILIKDFLGGPGR